MAPNNQNFQYDYKSEAFSGGRSWSLGIMFARMGYYCFCPQTESVVDQLTNVGCLLFLFFLAMASVLVVLLPLFSLVQHWRISSGAESQLRAGQDLHVHGKLKKTSGIRCSRANDSNG